MNEIKLNDVVSVKVFKVYPRLTCVRIVDSGELLSNFEISMYYGPDFRFHAIDDRRFIFQKDDGGFVILPERLLKAGRFVHVS